MYLRFIAPVAPGGYTVTRSHVAPGLFGPAYDLWWARDEMTPALIGIRRELDWFNANLPAPQRLGVKAKGRWFRDGVCWFRDSARDMLSHAHTLAALRPHLLLQSPPRTVSGSSASCRPRPARVPGVARPRG